MVTPAASLENDGETGWTMDEQLTELVRDLTEAAGPNLLAVILYGSAATGEFHAKHSDLNLLCLFDKLDADTLARLNPTTRKWVRKGHPPPLVFAASQLARAADVFAIELLDIKARHKVLQGADLLAGIDVPLALHHLQVERELRQALVRLREHYLAGDGDTKAVLGLMTASVSTFATLFRHATVALGAPVADLQKLLRKRDSIDHLAAMLGFSAVPFHTALDLREGKIDAGKVDAGVLFGEYLAAVSMVVNEIDRRLADRSGV
jgi:hypothetical protein